ncbi:hypothetical protein PROFUN_01901 [Planoprotostelium fungivorum]|uniref:SET domain-containing protein n=1 Tax=Planoprotostelium fungivorum TaxID=1890364 RepID=A0A2P6NYZ5_9EUKA|nr:hypothetical protein PROFUN_01901 [Planoprotostelium fungivorum]
MDHMEGKKEPPDGSDVSPHETAMVTDRDSPTFFHQVMPSRVTHHLPQNTWYGLEESARWSIRFDPLKGNVLVSKKRISAGTEILQEKALIIHAVKDKILKTCCSCGLAVPYVAGRLPPTFCDTCNPPWKDIEIDAFCSLWPAAWKSGTVVHSLRILHTVCSLSLQEIETFSQLGRVFPDRPVDHESHWTSAGELVAAQLQGEYKEKMDKLRGLLDNNLLNINKITNANSFGYDVMGVYLQSSILSHSCDPNCRWEINGNNLTIHSLREIDEDEEITVCYVPLVNTWGLDLRRAVIARRRGFLCMCDRCKVEEEELEKADPLR